MKSLHKKQEYFKHKVYEGHKGKTFGFYLYYFVYFVSFVFKSCLPQVGLSELGYSWNSCSKHAIEIRTRQATLRRPFPYFKVRTKDTTCQICSSVSTPFQPSMAVPGLPVLMRQNR